jgi:YihY family inner membrane protein
MENLSAAMADSKAELGKMWRFINFQLRIWPQCARLLIKNRATQVAAALSYQTIFGIVPLAIVVLMVFAWINSVSNLGFSVKSLLLEQAFFNIPYPTDNPAVHITLADKIDDILKNALANINTGSITIVGVVFVIWAAIALLITIEAAFNTIWHVPEERSLARRIINYWTMLTLGPMLIGAGIYASTQYGGELNVSMLSRIAPVLTYLTAFIAFFCLYYLMPNVKVKARAAMWGSAVATVAWTIARWGFAVYVTKGIPYWKIYGVMGLIPLAVFWIYLSWLIVLFGLELTYTTQNLKSIEDAEAEAAARQEAGFIANEMTIINVMGYIAHEFAQRRGPVEVQTICREFKIPAEFTNVLLGHLVNKGLLLKTAEPHVGFVLAAEPANIKLSDISVAIAAASLAQPAASREDTLAEISKKQKELLEQYTLEQL